ncbi:Ribosome biogenesis protein BRX1 like protein [Chelonia mydas]|uniref:Ribosome biogenesis protein BRX1 homolog n=1 Tax=Chelonia mydas TaxID=8469 RepID=M7BIC1_CHEMY|nr:Ribosome biogenesis protein BRX1 like protein [Chelonia mydas]
MAAAKRKRGGAATRPRKRARGAPNGSGPPAKPSPQGAEREEHSIPAPISKGKWKNKERVLIFSSRGINFRTRHLMQDLRTLMPHSKADTKMDRKDKLFVINEFDQEPHYALLKELFIQIFSTPQYHPKSQPFVDHVFTFSITDNRIWFRNYQHRRMTRLAVAAKFREKQQVKDLQKLRKKEEKTIIPEDPTETVFETPAEEKPLEIELVKPQLKVNLKKKKKLFQRQRKRQKKLSGVGV